jgi:Flp pilus assembly protein TadB
METEARDRSIAELLRDLSNETTLLVRQEMELARAELIEHAKPAKASAASFGATALFGLGAFGAATAFLIAVIALAIPVWAAALIVTIVYGIAAYVLAENGKKKLKEAGPPVIPQTAQTLKEDIAWAKTQSKSATK